MPVLSINKPLEQGEPLLLVENRLGLGRHRFSLVVVDNDGIASDAAFFTVTVRDPRITFPPVVGPLDPVPPIVRPPVPGPVIDPVGPVIDPAVRPPIAPITPVVTPITPVRPRRPRGPTR